MSIKVIVGQEYDGFYIEIEESFENGVGSKQYFHFSQEDTIEELVDVFKSLGIHAEFEENY